MKTPYVSIIVPAYNEEDRISRSLSRIHEYLSLQKYSWEILVVIDGATDNTFNMVHEFESLFEDRLTIINNKKNHGKGYVVRQGMLKASGEFRVFTDADNSTDISHLDAMIVKFGEGYDVVIGTRDDKDVPGAKQEIKQSFLKRLLGNMGNLFIQLVAVRGIWDTQNGFKGFSAKAAQEIFSRTVIDKWGFDIEVLALARQLDYRVGIIPVFWKNDPKSHVKLSGYFRTLWETVQVRLNIWRGKYKRPLD